MSNGKLQGKVAIVTGGGQGIGRGITQVFAQEGAKVMIATRTARHGEDTKRLVREAGGTAELCTADIGSKEQADRVVAETVRTFGQVDILVHNAGSFLGGPVEQYSEADLDTVLSVNLKACFRLSAACIPHMRKRGAGRLLFTSSVTGPRVAMPSTSYYAASKGGINAFIRTAAVELAREKITVNGVEPGVHPHRRDGAAGERGRDEGDGQVHPNGLHRRSQGHCLRDAVSRLRRGALRHRGRPFAVDGGSTLPESPVFLQELEGIKSLGASVANRPDVDGIPARAPLPRARSATPRSFTSGRCISCAARACGCGTSRGGATSMPTTTSRDVGHCHPHVVEAIARRRPGSTRYAVPARG